jgi:Arc/MetJ-type ribon-helix-helix transcriptional regulator
MPVSISQTLRVALSKLRGERTRIDSQIAALEHALLALERTGPGNGATSRRKRKRMPVAARKAISLKLRAYWAKRRTIAGKGGAKGKGARTSK